MSKYIVCLCEGKKTEPLLIDNLKKYFLDEQIIKVVHGTVIYQLYKALFKDNGEIDEYLDFFEVIKETYNDLKDISREDIARIYLFFDYDGHASNATDNKLQDMLTFFNNETKDGQLYISYPMAEAIKHLNRGICFKNTKAISNPEYKNLVSNNCNDDLKNVSKLSKENWNLIINEHCKKANYIVNNDFKFPNDIIRQISIWEKQKEKYINIENEISVLSAFPLFLLDYYGAESLQNKIL